MRLFTRRTKVSPEAETAMRAAEKSLQQAQAHYPEVEAKLTESRRVKEQLRAHNRANQYSDWIEAVVLGRLSDG
ncbi:MULTISPECIES: hypothetical protein [unclassified Streptomyces]|uniref:DUF7620 family protein n=1 Tax=unclassified Streptomyces TaxID=2593676 RepID=UPI0038132B84